VPRIMSEIALQLKDSVEADVTPAFAWRFRTDVANWNDPPARFALDGPFEAGSCGTTLLPGQAPLHWRITEVRLGKSFVVAIQLDQAMLAFEWRFDELPDIERNSHRKSCCRVITREHTPRRLKQDSVLIFRPA
jgi:hypothetical protein